MNRFNRSRQRATGRFSDTALIVLGRAADHEHQMLLPIPKSVRAHGIVLDRVLRNLLDRELVEEISVSAPEHAWRSDDQGQVGLRITPAGLKAVGMPALVSGLDGGSKPRAPETAPLYSRAHSKPDRLTC